jgi:hypothetical protein
LPLAFASYPIALEEPMADPLTLLAEPVFTMIDLALDRPLAALLASSALAVVIGAVVLAAR